MLIFLLPLLLLASPALAQPPPETPPYNGPLMDEEKALIVNALERQKEELVADPKTVDASTRTEVRLVMQGWQNGLVDQTILPTIGLALSRATNVEVDRIDENGVKVIDNAASRAASKPYCDLLKKLNPQAGCVKW